MENLACGQFSTDHRRYSRMPEKMKKLRAEDYNSFKKEGCVAILFDASWDIGPGGQIREKIKSAKEKFNKSILFAEIDVEEEPEIAKSRKILNLPSIAYFKSGNLIKLEVGASQNIEQNIFGLLK